MIKLNLLFVLLLITALLRFIILGAFEPLMFSMIFLFPVAALAIFIMSKKLAVKERFYQPKNIKDWSFYNIQKLLMIQKPLYKGDEQRGYVKRYFPQKWQYVIADIFGFNWYLSLEIQIDRDVYDVRWYHGKRFAQQDQWHIYKNGEQVGEAQTRINLKNTTKLKETIAYSIYGRTYLSHASSITSTISLTQNESLLGSLKRNHIISGVQVIDVQENRPECIIALMLHAYYFK